MTPGELEREVQRLGPWFHNLDLHGVKTAPNHFLGDYSIIQVAQFRGGFRRI